MDRRIILLSGPVASGKSTLAGQLADQFDMTLLNTGDLLKAEMDGVDEPGRLDLQRMGDELDECTGGGWVLGGLDRLCGRDTQRSAVVDSVRAPEQIDEIRKVYGTVVIHVHLTAQLDELTVRYDRRESLEKSESLTYEDVLKNDTERTIDCRLGRIADVAIDTDRCDPSDVLVLVASHLRLIGVQNSGYVDVIIGGQYGSEGKGQIAAYLARDYDLLLRVGGPNAGHRVYEEPKPYTHHQLPSGTGRNADAKLLIGPGAVLNVDELLEEIADCKVEFDRLHIDRNAMIIAPADRDSELSLYHFCVMSPHSRWAVRWIPAFAGMTEEGALRHVIYGVVTANWY